MAVRLRDNVRRGARLLDKLAPGRWYKSSKIALGRLDMVSTCNCISGQLREKDPDLRERFVEAAREIDGYDFSLNGFPKRYGCDLPEGVDNAERGYEILQDEWEKQIRARRQADRV